MDQENTKRKLEIQSISDILEKRGWIRTKDRNYTQFTIKWCLERNVDWSKFEAGEQLVNNIPGQIYFSDKVNLWYTIQEYVINRRQKEGEIHIYSFLPVTFVLDNENEVNEFLRIYKKHNRTWICKPRYSYAGRGIYVITVNSDLNSIFKLKVGIGNRLQYQPKLPGYLMQEQVSIIDRYIARPLLIKGKKFDIRVHFLIAWAKPLLVFYNHIASVVRLSLNLYREFDFDRATHLTNLSVQENHYRYAFSQENTGMTMTQLNHYFNQCFRPFNPNMCEDWVMKVMQIRMQSIIRHVIRASRHRLTCTPGFFGIYGCDFLLDENFRIWLLEINDNPGVGWGNTRVNTTTKPLFEETLDIVWECFQKNKSGKPLLPIECLKNYHLIYNDDDDNVSLIPDENHSFIQCSPTVSRYTIRDNNNTRLSRSRVKTAATIIPARTSESQDGLSSQKDPLRNLANANIESLKHDDDIELERLQTNIKTKQSIKLPNRSQMMLKNNTKRPISVSNSFIIRKKREITVSPTFSIKKKHSQRNSIPSMSMIQRQQPTPKNNKIPLKNDDISPKSSSDVTEIATNLTPTATSIENTALEQTYDDKPLKVIADTALNESSLTSSYERTF
ncbi:unnamed protein product [Didymodactylos carnosus]|uniref:ATP-grasp domain-containing protein n=1 Tax=Didymodactylos carnosus TaxID=1234261 RepID=A0A8S2ENP8_9BILA|nr:unnamed protein product [Didymodactylos carnosus]CAF4077449.1 unnamed protein product [Didymodactylos carnosus]